MDRLDKVLVELGHVKTRSAAKQLVEQGSVLYKGKEVSKVGLKVDPNLVEVKEVFPYVGRGALKLKKAHEDFSLDFQNKVIADVGASTGGFTDYALQEGASKSYAIDVGQDQLAQKLIDDERVINLEKTNIRNGLKLEPLADMAVVDLSFISLKLTLESIFTLIHDKGEVVCLVKPQFEAGKERMGKNGIISDPATRLEVLNELYDWCLENDLKLTRASISPISGKQGNTEYLFYFDRSSSELLPREDLKGLVE